MLFKNRKKGNWSGALKKILSAPCCLFFTVFSVLIFLALSAALTGCSFDYGDLISEDESQPDIVMGEVEYVRVRDGDPVVRFRAQQAERYEKRQTMELKNFSFEQFYNHGDEVNATGRAGNALVELDSGNIYLERSVIISVESEDITIETNNLSWRDHERTLSSEEENTVDIQRTDGTVFSGKGFSADVRNRTWVFSGGAAGTYIDEDEADKETPAGFDAETGAITGSDGPDMTGEAASETEQDEPLEAALWS